MNAQEHKIDLIRIKNEALSVAGTKKFRDLVKDFIRRYEHWQKKLAEYQKEAIGNPKLRITNLNNLGEPPLLDYEIEKENLITLEDGTKSAFWRPLLPLNPLELIMPTNPYDYINQGYDYWSTVKNIHRDGNVDEEEILVADAFLIAVIGHKIPNGIKNIELPEYLANAVWQYHNALDDMTELQRGDKTREKIRKALEHVKAECSKESLSKKHDEKTLVDRFFIKIKNHPLISIPIVLGIVIVGFATVLNSLDTIAGFTRKLFIRNDIGQNVSPDSNSTEKSKVIDRIIKKNPMKEEALKLSDMANKTLLEDLKSFLENKNLKVDEQNHPSLIGSGIFKAEAKDDWAARRLAMPTGHPEIVYELTPDGNKLYEIAKDVNF